MQERAKRYSEEMEGMSSVDAFLRRKGWCLISSATVGVQ